MIDRLFDTGAPTATERADRHRAAQAAQAELFDPRAMIRPTLDCPVCAGEHGAIDCPHGTAPGLFAPEPGAVCQHCETPTGWNPRTRTFCHTATGRETCAQ